MNTKLNNRPLYEDVAERLRAQIFAHELAPGSWLDEQSLAIAFGISRTPMREAIKVLASEGVKVSPLPVPSDLKKPTFFDERNTNLSIPSATKAKGIRLGVIVQK